jgi:hypothetical protein
LRQHPTEAIRNLCIDLTDIDTDTENEAGEKSLWESKWKIYIRTIYNDSGTLLEEAIRILQVLRLEKIRRLKNEAMEGLRTADEENGILLLNDIKLLNDKIMEIEAVLGTAYRLR